MINKRTFANTRVSFCFIGDNKVSQEIQGSSYLFGIQVGAWLEDPEVAAEDLLIGGEQTAPSKRNLSMSVKLPSAMGLGLSDTVGEAYIPWSFYPVPYLFVHIEATQGAPQPLPQSSSSLLLPLHEELICSISNTNSFMNDWHLFKQYSFVVLLQHHEFLA
jgi:hypothetical protein